MMANSTRALIGLFVFAALLASVPATAATLELQLAGSNITGLADNTSLWGIPWEDSSGNDRDALPTQSYWSPAYEEGEAGVFGGQDYLYFSNSDSEVGSASLSGWGFTMMAVANFAGERNIMSFSDSAVSTRDIFFAVEADGNLRVWYREGTYPTYSAVTTGQNFLGEDHLFVADFRGQGNLVVSVDGQAVPLTYTGNGDPTLTFTGFDVYGIGSGPGDANFAEVRYYSGSWDTNELEAVTEGLMDTYDIVPEPATMGLLLVGGVGLITRRRRR